jgi:toxin HigB-1
VSVNNSVAIKFKNMQIRFNDPYLERLYENEKIGGKPKFSKSVIKGFKEVVKTIKFIASSQDLYHFKSLHFEKLKGDLSGYHSVRVDRKYRLVFSIESDEILIQEIIVIEDLTNHYGD